MEDQWEACGDHVLIFRDESVSERNGMWLPDSAKKKASTGNIISSGTQIKEKRIKAGKKALFNQTAGFELELPEGVTITVQKAVDIIATK